MPADLRRRRVRRAVAASHARADALRAELERPTPKRHRRGTERAVPVADMLLATRDVLPAAGITRVARISGLDRVGVPVYSAIRPNSRSVSVSQGKGVTDEAARLSAILEAVELHVAERREEHVTVTAPRDDLERADAEVIPDSVLRWRDPDAPPGDGEPVPRVLGVDVVGGADTWVPHEVVHMDDRHPFRPGEGLFRAGSNGLASGANPVEATLHALCELVERDAVMALEKLPDDDRHGRRIDLAAVDDPDCCALLERLAASGLTPLVWDATDVAGLPTFDCMVIDTRAPSLVGFPLPQTTGSGTHPTPVVALLRALTEALQSRASVIAGAREDIPRSRYALYYDEAFVAAWQEELDAPSMAPMPARTTPERDDLRLDVADVVGVLRARAVGPVVVVDLGRLGPAAVVRAVAPGLRWSTVDDVREDA